MKRIVSFSSGAPHPPSPNTLFFEALSKVLGNDNWEDCLLKPVQKSTIKSIILNPDNWCESPPPEPVGIVNGDKKQRSLTPAQLQTILACAGVKMDSNTYPYIEIRYSDGKSGRSAPYWHIDFDHENPPKFDIFTVAFSESEAGGTVYLSLPRFNSSCLEQLALSEQERRDYLQSIQYFLEQLLRVNVDSDWILGYARHTTPTVIYKNLTQDFFHKSPDIKYQRVLFVIGVPKP